MAITLNLNEKRAVITDAFKNQWKTTYIGLLDKYKRAINNAPTSMREAVKKKYANQMVRIYNTITTPGGFDYEMTRLRALPFARFDVQPIGSSIWYEVQTKDIIAETPDEGGRRRIVKRKFDIGSYTIYIRTDAMESGNLNSIHFVPNRQPLAISRHLHHYGRCQYGANGKPNVSHPVEMSPSTCWGNFPNVVSGCMSDGDLVELYRTLYIYLSIFNTGSPLVQMHDLLNTFVTEVL